MLFFGCGFTVNETGNVCVEDPDRAEIRKRILVFEKKFKLYVVFSVFYGLIFVNYIDVITNGSSFGAYHMWLAIMYFFPFAILTLLFRRNWQLTIGLGLLASLMNDVFYGPVRNLMGYPYDLTLYYSRWLIPSDATLFQLNLGFAVVQVFSWMMALSIYLRVGVVFVLLWTWKRQAKIRCINEGKEKLGNNPVEPTKPM